MFLDSFLNHQPSFCPGCRKQIDGTNTGECPRCGETLALEVRSTRQRRWSDLQSLPILIVFVVSLTGAISQIPVMLFVWAQSRGVVPPGPSLIAAHTVSLAVPTSIAGWIFFARHRLLRARLRDSIGLAVIAIAALIGTHRLVQSL